MKPLEDLAGRRYGRLTVVRRLPNVTRGNTIWLCKCDCGGESITQSGALKRGITSSCGCLQRQVATTHGMEGSRTYNIWAKMKQRCANPDDKGYPDYGGRGISYCQEWESFETFFRDMGTAPKGLSLERVNNNLGYSSANCKWATPKEQRRNTRVTRYIEFRGVKKAMTEWAETIGVSPQTLRSRLNLGWSAEDVLTKPIDQRKATKRKKD